ncbi:glycoside hydrolase family 13 protein [Mucilaginibacter arboris]|uniref:Alpha,alpha-phosphotrehalase n=1 Tax=Mucilaginibacter arboris TaxID=2682090 RepID=A0A7K1SXT5_9SPHI|nr:alpha-glucosidase [Mucilaginibacter arboris]MVN22139.1 alpha,alpha-phosphotrehalase [Mucilaginibacter arboris]
MLTSAQEKSGSQHSNIYAAVPGPKWWKEAVVYQIYPRSFKDSNGDGIGDLQGIISKLDYIQSLGVDVVWLNPIYPSPNCDNGYDVSDYEAINPEFGTMQDFNELLQGLHQRNLKLVMDLVVNHTSDEHKWFKEARSSRQNPYRNYYHWWPAENGKPPYRDSFFDVEDGAWKYDGQTDSYYLHYFSVKQPDLNWENPVVRKEIFKMMHFWFDKGVDGFRMDVISYISKDTNFPVITQEYLDKNDKGKWGLYYAKGPKLHDYLQQMNREVLSQYEIMTVGEGSGVTINEAMNFVDPDRKELDMFFHFDGMNLGLTESRYKQPDPAGWKLTDFKKLYSSWSDIFKEKGWGSIYLGNHDQPRMLSRWGNDTIAFREASAKLLLTFLLTMRATPYVFAGDEIGMSNIKFDDIGDYRDIETLNWYKKLQQDGEDTQKYLEGWKLTARDNSRTPFQWNSETNSGFSSAKPWIKVNPNFSAVNEALQQADPDSILNYFRKVIQLRKANPGLIYGKYELLDKDHEQVYAYIRSLDKQQLLVMFNFSTKEAEFNLPFNISHDAVLINNYQVLKLDRQKAYLRPYQSVIISITN